MRSLLIFDHLLSEWPPGRIKLSTQRQFATRHRSNIAHGINDHAIAMPGDIGNDGIGARLCLRMPPLNQSRCIYDGEHPAAQRSEEHTSELQSLMRISYAVFCLKKKKQTQHTIC